MEKERIFLTYKDVISGEADKYIGKPGRFSDYLYEDNNYHWSSGSLDGFNHGNLQIPFVNSKIGCYQFFSPDPEPEYKNVPFTFDDAPMFRDNWIRINTDFSRIIFYDLEGVYLYVCGFIRFVNYPNLLKEFLFEDGTPCGKKEMVQ